MVRVVAQDRAVLDCWLGFVRRSLANTTMSMVSQDRDQRGGWRGCSGFMVTGEREGREIG